MIEQLIAEHTAALKENTAALRENTAALTGGDTAAPAINAGCSHGIVGTHGFVDGNPQT